MADRPAWYGGNKIPASYLKRFLPSQGRREDFPQELRLFLDHIGDDDEAQTRQCCTAEI